MKHHDEHEEHHEGF